MRTIDITTTQKVTIQYELASLRDRALAYIIDALVVLGSILILNLFFLGAFGDGIANIFEFSIQYPLIIFYTLLMEYFNDGQTVGKLVVGIKVVKLDGKSPNFSDYLTRWVFRAIDIYLSMFSIGSLLISSSDKAQRLGDMTANTTLIKVRFNLRFKLDDIEKISTLSNYEPTFPQVRQLDEEDMLLIKNIITRVQKYPNSAHKEALERLITDLMLRLDITEQPPNKIEFLKILIKDYIVLTR